MPLYVNVGKVVAALLAGCTVILKPAPDTPWSATEFGRLVAECTDIPAGVYLLRISTNRDLIDAMPIVILNE